MDGSRYTLKLTFVALDLGVYHVEYYPTKSSLNNNHYGGKEFGNYTFQSNIDDQMDEADDLLR